MNTKNIWNIIWKILIVLTLAVGTISISMNLLAGRLEQRNETGSAETSTVDTYVPEKDAHVIQILGAGMIDYGLYAPQVQDYSSCFENLAKMISNYQVCAYTQRTLPGTQVPAAFTENVKAIGFSSVALATPNSLANGKDGVDKALVFWDAQELQQAGMYWSTDQQNLIRPIERNGITVVYLSYTDYLNDELPEHEKYLVNVYDDEKTPQFVAQAAEEADVVVVSICWEGENLSYPSERQQTIAKALADAGASVILGNAENAIQPVAWIDDTLIYYSMGNLLSDDEEDLNRLGLVGSVTITKTATYDKSKIELTNPKVDIVYSEADGSGQYITEAFVNLENGTIDEQDRLYEEITGVLHMMDDSIRIGGLQ